MKIIDDYLKILHEQKMKIKEADDDMELDDDLFKDMPKDSNINIDDLEADTSRSIRG